MEPLFKQATSNFMRSADPRQVIEREMGLTIEALRWASANAPIVIDTLKKARAGDDLDLYREIVRGAAEAERHGFHEWSVPGIGLFAIVKDGQADVPGYATVRPSELGEFAAGGEEALIACLRIKEKLCVRTPKPPGQPKPRAEPKPPYPRTLKLTPMTQVELGI